MKDHYPIHLLCEVMDVSPSGYYDWLKRRHSPSPRTRENQALTEEIKILFAQSRETYGSPRITAQLRQSGRQPGRRRIARLMKENRLCGRQKRRYRVQTTDSQHDHPIAPNFLAQAPAPSAPNQTWVSDITYIRTEQSWLFLAAIMDLYTRKIVGWAMSPTIDTSLTLKALHMALLQQRPGPNLILHSDRGVQYAASDYRQALARAGLLASMSRKANCYDNAAMESFWSTLKLELIYRCNFPSHQHARSQIFDYIEIFYNRQRSHSALGFLSPIDFELKYN